MKLRDYQNELLLSIKREMMMGKQSVCAVLGCGGGKSVIQAHIAKSATDKGNQVLFLVHRRELCAQIEQTFVQCGVDLSLCQIAMVQTITRRLGKIPEPKIIITDEAHHALSDSYKRIYNFFPDALRIGFTATPIRMNEGGLGNVFDGLIEGVSTPWLIENNFLAPYRYYSVKLADTSNLHIKRGDYDSREVAELMEDRVIYGETIKNYRKIADGKKTIIYCASVEASKKTAEEFKAIGIRAAHLDATTPKELRNQIIRQFRSGEVQVLCNVELLGEGFDVPDCECVILLRPTKSLTLFIQQSMRSMRYQANKTALIIDHVGNVFQHDFPDAIREWSLSSKKKKQKSTIKIKECSVCYYCLPSNVKICPACGYEFTSQERGEIETIDVELAEITHLNILATKSYDHYKSLKTFDELVLFQKAKKYKFSWVLHKCIELRIPVPKKYQFLLEMGYVG